MPISNFGSVGEVWESDECDRFIVDFQIWLMLLGEKFINRSQDSYKNRKKVVYRNIKVLIL
jgi:hypothetical protein